MAVKGYAKFLLIMAGLGGLLYGVDVGVIAAALPYIERTSTFTSDEIGWIVGMALWGSLPSSLVAGILAEWFGRKKMIIASALLFLISIPVICASGFFEGGNFWMMVGGRALQGAAAGLFGVIVPMYLAECLDADSRGKGTGMFQLLLTIGLVFVAVIGVGVTRFVGSAKDLVDAAALKNGVEAASVTFAQVKAWFSAEQVAEWVRAWQMIFLFSCVPGFILFLGAFRLKESSRWLWKRGIAYEKKAENQKKYATEGEAYVKSLGFDIVAVFAKAKRLLFDYKVKSEKYKAAALASLSANNGEEKAKEILAEMIAADEAAAAEKAKNAAATDSLLQKKYVIPFVLAVVILACNQTTGINSVLNYTVTIFQKTGMHGDTANWADAAIKIMNCVMTVVACALVDKKGRKFLLKLGTSGIIVGLCGVGSIFLAISKGWVAASMTTGVLATVFFFMFIGFYAVGPGVCVWLALTELMPTRIRATGMSIAMIINQGVSAGIATVFPKWCAATNDNGTVFFVLAGFTVVYFITAAFFLPETKGRTLEEVEQYFTTGRMPEKKA